LGLADRIRSHLSVDQSLPAAGQGALGIEVLADRADLHQWLAPLASPDATACSAAERAVSYELGGSCQVPLAAYATIDNGQLQLSALVAEPDGSVIIRSQASGSPDDAQALGQQVAHELLAKGARPILDRLGGDAGQP